MELRQILYVSIPRIEVNPLILTSIVDASIENNERDNITGVLSLDEQQNFIQFIEGPADKIASCFQRILQDTRHECVAIKLDQYTSMRVCEGWHMRLSNQNLMKQFLPSFHTANISHKLNENVALSTSATI